MDAIPYSKEGGDGDLVTATRIREIRLVGKLCKRLLGVAVLPVVARRHSGKNTEQRIQCNALHESALWWGMERITVGGKVSALVFRARACVRTVNWRCWGCY